MYRMKRNPARRYNPHWLHVSFCRLRLYSSSCSCFYFSHIAERTRPLVKLVPRQLAKIHYSTCLPTLHQTKNKLMISTNIHPREEWTALQDLQLNDTSLSKVCKTVINDESGVKLTYHSIYQHNTVRARNSYSARIKINKTCWFLTNFYICREQKSQVLLKKLLNNGIFTTFAGEPD